MINIIGLLIIIIGFFIPFYNVAYPYVSSIYFFWLGGLLCLNKGILIRRNFRWAKWAQIGILIHIAVSIINLVPTFLIEGFVSSFEFWLSQTLYWISSPATAIGQYMYPYPETPQLDGSVLIQISHIRSVITSFINVAIFALISSLIGIVWQKRKVNEQIKGEATFN